MNRPTDDSEQFDLQRQIAEALSPTPLSDERVDRLSTDDVSTTDEAQLTRILGRTQQLLLETRATPGWHRGAGHSNVEVTMQRMGKSDLPRRQRPRGAVAALAVATMALLVVLFWSSQESYRQRALQAQAAEEQAAHLADIQTAWLTPQEPVLAELTRLNVGDTIETDERERRRVGLPDGSVLFVNAQSHVTVASPRRVHVQRGEVFVEVVPQFDEPLHKEAFEVVTPTRTVVALGTRFGVQAEQGQSAVVVTQGRVKVSGVDDVVESGQELQAVGTRPPQILTAMRASERLSWTRELRTGAAGKWVPDSQHAGGSIISVDPAGQEMRLSLRKYHVDVHIEDGFARTTIDQTYFNHTQSRLEGTFHFPLPPDASLSRLAMYVNGRLIEGGMAERQHARNTFEQIVHKMKDPALLEWVDGTTFKMRVFPLEPRQEKRIVLSYTQRLETAYGRSTYRFPAGHSMDRVRQWSTAIRVAGGKGQNWVSPTHSLKDVTEEQDLILSAEKKNAAMNSDLVLELADAASKKGGTRPAAAEWTTAEHDGDTYLMMKYAPRLPRSRQRPQRNWVIVFEAAADRNPLLAGTQLEIVRTLLTNAEHDDTFSILTANTQAVWLQDEPQTCSAAHVRDALKQLQRTHLVGALDLEQALKTAGSRCRVDQDSPVENMLVHLGSAIPVLGQQDHGELLRILPDDLQYVGIGVGRHWSRPLMKAAAGRTGGYFTQINPDDEVAWRSFELSSLLNAPRLLDVSVKADDESDSHWLNYAETVVDGEQICAITKLAAGQSLPERVVIEGTCDGRTWRETVRVRRPRSGADYLPRSWTRLEIDRLLADSGAEHRSEIIRLSKSMYVMSPFTSLLVLENEQMYTQFGIDRGRDDHWALYPCPAQIKVVQEPLIGPPTVADAAAEALTGPGSLRELPRLTGLIAQGRGPATIVLSDGSAVTPLRSRLLTVPPNVRLAPGRSPDGVNDRIWFSNGASDGIFNQSTLYNVSGVTDLSSLDVLSTDVLSSSVLSADVNGNLSLSVAAVPFQLQSDQTVGFVTPSVALTPDVKFVLPEFAAPDTTAWEMRFAVPQSAGQSNGRTLVPSLGWQPGQPAPYLGPFYPYQNQLWAEPGPLASFQQPNIIIGQQEAVLGVARQQAPIPLSWSRPALSWDDDWMVDFDSDGLIPGDLPRPQLRQLADLEARLMAIEPGLQDLSFAQRQSLQQVREVERMVEQRVQLREQIVDEQLADAYIRLPELQQQVGQSRFGWRYRQPAVVVDPVQHASTLWRDLLAFAPALNTSMTDVLAAQAEQVRSDLPGSETDASTGEVDDGARQLIDRARAAGFETVGLTVNGKRVLEIVCDGAGRHTYESISRMGLQQRVTCDGRNLWHVVPQLGLAARRQFSGFHFRDLQTLVPWLVRSADELSHHADVRLVKENVVAVVPHTVVSEGATPTEGQRTREMHLVFATDGRLRERRVVETDSGRVLRSIRFQKDGSLKITGDGDLRTASREAVTWSREAASAPSLTGPSDEIVQLPLPVRSVAAVDDVVAIEQDGEPARDDDHAKSLRTQEQSLSRILALLAEGRAIEARDEIRSRFLDQGDRRAGLYVLLSRMPFNMVWQEDVGGADGRRREVDLRPSAEASELLQFVRQHMEMWQSGPTEFDLASDDDAFIARLAQAHNVAIRWGAGKATASRTQAQISEELQRSLSVIAELPDSAMTWNLLQTIQGQLQEAGHRAVLAAALRKYESSPLLSRLARQERARLLFQSGRAAKGRNVYRQLLTSVAEQGRRPVIDAELRELFVAEGDAAWQKAVQDCGARLLQADRLRAAFELSVQLRTLGDIDTAGELLDEVVVRLQQSPQSAHPALAVQAIDQLRQLKDGRAEDLMGDVLSVTTLADDARLWRFAAQVADDLGHRQAALLRMEQAVFLEYQQGVKFVDVSKLRETYQGLMQRFAEVIDAAATLETDVPDDLYARLIRAADQWRSLDADATTCCQTTARLLMKLKRRDEAWQYLTTPLAGRSGESAPWRTLAQSLTESQDVDLADMAFARAFATEQTNPEILLEHAVFLQSRHRRVAAERLLRQIVNSNWQPRFAHVRQQAQSMLP